MSLVESQSNSSEPREQVMHGPYRPLDATGLVKLQQWEGDEYDLTDTALQHLHQLHGHFDAINEATTSGNLDADQARTRRMSIDRVQNYILDHHLTR